MFEHLLIRSDDRGLYQYIQNDKYTYVKQYLLYYSQQDIHIETLNKLHDEYSKTEYKLYMIYNQLRRKNSPKDSI